MDNFFSKDSRIVKNYVLLIENNEDGAIVIPDLYNLRKVVNEVVEENKKHSTIELRNS